MSEYLPTTPGTQMRWSGPPRRRRPCWRCRLGLVRPRHWACQAPAGKLLYLDLATKPRDPEL